MASPRNVVLCADDYGLTEGVSRGILELAGTSRISATSAMSNMPEWPRLARDLRPFAGRIAIGLHLNFTTGSPLGAMPNLAPAGTFPGLDALIGRASFGRLSLREVSAEIERQLGAFERALGRPPAFIDGHQHVQVLPGLRHALVEVLKARGASEIGWLRDPSDAVMPILRRRLGADKALVVKAFAIGYRRLARNAGFDTNEGFSGFSPLDIETSAERVLEQAFRELGPRPVVMCHPGYVDADLRGLDPAVESREAELAYLSSDAFGNLLEERRITLVVRP